MNNVNILAETLGRCIEDLEIATGMLMVPSMTSNTITRAMEMVAEVSVELSCMLDIDDIAIEE